MKPISSVLTLGASLLLLAFGQPLALAYVHPGAPLSLVDLQTLKAKVDANQEPWKSGYAALTADGHSLLTYNMRGPFAEVGRAPDVNRNEWDNDMIAIWNLSLMWNFTGDTAYAQKAHDILLAWANTQTSFTGGERMLELGDYAYKFVGGADILRGTWPGWTAADTTAVKAYFGNVLMPATNPYGESMFGAANKGALSLCAKGLMAIFNDDTTTLDTVVYQIRTLAHIGLRSSNDIGQIGDSGRDQGHAYGQLLSLTMLAEALWKQGIDVYSDSNNRLLAAGEYFARVNNLTPTTFLPFGSTDNYYPTPWYTDQIAAGNLALSILQGAYVVRKGLPAPCIAQRLQDCPVDGASFVFLKDADTSSATPAAALAIPDTTSITSGFSEAEIGGASPTGNSSYSGGTWTVQGGGSNMWGATNDSCHFTYKAVTGDCAIIAKVQSVQNTNAGANAGVMIRTSLSQGAPRAWIAVIPNNFFQQNIEGLAVYGGIGYSNKGYSIPSASYWVKLERIGNIVTGYVSPDGTNWAATDVGRLDNPPATWYVGLVVCSDANGTLNTSTFSNVQITGGNGGAPVVTPAAPAACLAASGENAVSLRWQPSFGATSYTIKRATSSGGTYSTVASGITASNYTDATGTNGTTYYYVVTATNSAGTSTNSPEDSATPISPMVNIAFGGTATASSETVVNGKGAAAQAFDASSMTQWVSAATTGWLRYDFGSGNAQTIKRYTLTSSYDLATRDPKDWQFQGSNDGSTWTTLDTQSNQAFAARFQTNIYSIASPASYRYYQLNVTANNGSTLFVEPAELGLWSDTGRTVRDGTYRVLNKNSRKALDVYNSGTADNTNVDQWSWNGGNNQKWTLTYVGNGQYNAMGVGSGKLLEVLASSTANGANIEIWSATNTNRQKWTLTPVGNGNYKFLNGVSGKAAEVSGSSTADGANVQQWTYGGGDNQQWQISIAP